MKIKNALIILTIMATLGLCSCGCTSSTNTDMTNDSAAVTPETTTTLE